MGWIQFDCNSMLHVVQEIMIRQSCGHVVTKKNVDHIIGHCDGNPKCTSSSVISRSGLNNVDHCQHDTNL